MLSGSPDPTDDPRFAAVVRGFGSRAAGPGRGQIAELRWSKTEKMADRAAEAGDLRGLRDSAMVSVGSDGLLRASEIAALNVSDFRTESDGSGRLDIRRVKDQGPDARPQTVYLGPETAKSLRDWMEAAGISDGPLFRRVRRGSIRGDGPLHPGSVGRIVTQRAHEARVDGRVGSHSFRVGSAQELAARGAGEGEMQQAGGWKSPTMPAHYAGGQLAGRGAVTRLRYGVREGG